MHGEIWNAESVSGLINKGEKIRVIGIKNLKLYVELFNTNKSKEFLCKQFLYFYSDYCFCVDHFINAIRILREYERGVIFRLGRLTGRGGVKGPGLILLIPIIDKMVKVSLRTVVMDVPPQDVITQDNVSIKVNAVVYFRVLEPQKAIVEVENYLVATSQLSQTTLRSVLGQSELDDLLSQREKINHKAAADHRCAYRTMGSKSFQC